MHCNNVIIKNQFHFVLSPQQNSNYVKLGRKISKQTTPKYLMERGRNTFFAGKKVNRAQSSYFFENNRVSFCPSKNI